MDVYYLPFSLIFFFYFVNSFIKNTWKSACTKFFSSDFCKRKQNVICNNFYVSCQETCCYKYLDQYIYFFSYFYKWLKSCNKISPSILPSGILLSLTLPSFCRFFFIIKLQKLWKEIKTHYSVFAFKKNLAKKGGLMIETLK